MMSRAFLWIGGIALAALAVTGVFAVQANRSSATTMEQNSTAAHASGVQIDVKKAAESRSLGNPDAPVKIEEFASLSCSHCAHFHKDTFPKLKAEYIDTGKVYFTFTDFPLNAPAIEGAVVSHCVPEDQYFSFLSFLFEQQEQWAFAPNFKIKLAQNAKLLGLNDETLKACDESAELRQSLIEKMQKAQKEHDIQSTPSFVFDGSTMVKGAQSFEEIKKLIDAKLGPAGAPAPSPEPTGESGTK